VALETNGGEERIRERLALLGAGQELVGFVEGYNAADGCVLLQEEREADVEKRTGRFRGDAGAGQIDDGELAGLGWVSESSNYCHI